MDGRRVKSRKVVIAGGSGFIGFGLVGELLAAHYEPVVLSRRQGVTLGARTVVWDGKSVGDWAKELEGAAAVVNLSGKSAFGRWTPEHRRAILRSRVEPTEAIGKAIQACKTPPPVWVNASAVGFYGDTGDKEVDEFGSLAQDPLAEVCRKWEAAQMDHDREGVRKVRLRIGFVLGRNGGAFPLLRRLTLCFLGSAIGSGRQWVPWIHLRDLCSCFRTCIESDVAGPVNGVGPEPVTNNQMMAELRRALRRPWAPNVPAPLLKLGEIFGLPPASVTLTSSRVRSSILPELGFRYRFPTLPSAFEDLVREGVAWPTEP